MSRKQAPARKQGKRVGRTRHVKKTRAPKSPSHADRVTEAWKRSWQSYLKRDMCAEDVVDAAIEYWKKQIQASDERAKESHGSSHGLCERFVEFAKKRSGDLSSNREGTDSHRLVGG